MRIHEQGINAMSKYLDQTSHTITSTILYLFRRDILVPRLRTVHQRECAATSRQQRRHTRDTRNQRDCRHASRRSNTSTAHPTNAEREPTTTGASLSHR